MLCGRKNRFPSLFFFFSFFYETSLLLGVEWCHRLKECARVWSVCRWLCFGACVFHCLRTHVSWVCCKVMSVCLYKQLQSCDSGLSLTHSAVAASPQIPTEWISFKRSPRCYKYTPLLNIDRIAPSLSPISVFFHLFFFLSVWASTTPPSSSLPSLLLPLSMRPLCSAFQSWTGGLSLPRLSLAELDHMVTEWAALLRYPPSSLGVHME